MHTVSRYAPARVPAFLSQSAFLLRLSLLLLLALSASASHAQTYDATADYSATNNPNGVWSAGYTSTDSLNSAFNLL